MIPHAHKPVWPAAGPPSFVSSVRTDACRVALLGLQDDLGIRLHNGRPGAIDGPTAFRAALAQFGEAYDAKEETPIGVTVYDAGNVVAAEGDDEAALAETHDRIAESVAGIHARGLIPVCIGGGHDLTSPAVRALASHVSTTVGGLNIDSQLDVHETAGSGMVFRTLIEKGHLAHDRYVVLGAGRFSNSKADTQWVRSGGGSVIDIDTALAHKNAVDVAFGKAFPYGADHTSDPGFVSMDLSGIDGAHAPGTSTVNPMGLPVAMAAKVAEIAGQSAAVQHFDIMELSPPHDVNNRTAHVAAMLFLRFLAGVRERPMRTTR